MTTPMTLEIRAHRAEAVEAEVAPKKLSTKSSSDTPTKPNIDDDDDLAELVGDLDVEELVGRERAAEGDHVPSTAPKTIDGSPPT